MGTRRQQDVPSEFARSHQMTFRKIPPSSLPPAGLGASFPCILISTWWLSCVAHPTYIKHLTFLCVLLIGVWLNTSACLLGVWTTALWIYSSYTHLSVPPFFWSFLLVGKRSLLVAFRRCQDLVSFWYVSVKFIRDFTEQKSIILIFLHLSFFFGLRNCAGGCVFFCLVFRSPFFFQGQNDLPVISSLSFLYSCTWHPLGRYSIWSLFGAAFGRISTLYFSPHCQSKPPLPLPPTLKLAPQLSGTTFTALQLCTPRRFYFWTLASVPLVHLLFYVNIPAVFITAPLGWLVIPRRPKALLYLFEIEHLMGFFFF